jgi:hypothetical protein
MVSSGYGTGGAAGGDAVLPAAPEGRGGMAGTREEWPGRAAGQPSTGGQSV